MSEIVLASLLHALIERLRDILTTQLMACNTKAFMLNEIEDSTIKLVLKLMGFKANISNMNDEEVILNKCEERLLNDKKRTALFELIGVDESDVQSEKYTACVAEVLLALRDYYERLRIENDSIQTKHPADESKPKNACIDPIRDIEVVATNDSDFGAENQQIGLANGQEHNIGTNKEISLTAADGIENLKPSVPSVKPKATSDTQRFSKNDNESIESKEDPDSNANHDRNVTFHVDENQDGNKFSTKRFEKFHKSWTGHSQWSQVDSDLLKNLSQKESLFGKTIDEAEDDDYLSAWMECLKLGIPWGGRGAGGRGIHRVTGETKDILVRNVSVTRGNNDLIDMATLKLNFGMKYGLIGRNGTGKSILLRRIATGRLPGFPPWLRVEHVQQELSFENIPELGVLTPVEFVLKFDCERTSLLDEEKAILARLDDKTIDIDESKRLQERLTEVYARLEQIDAYNAELKAEELLTEMGFRKKLLEKKMTELSGGWRMKASLAGALFMEPDVLLMDEPTNHLDIYAVKWLEDFLNSEKFGGTLLVVSHDRRFINNVCDELIFLKKKQLTYFAGTYDEYLEIKDQKHLMEIRKSDALDKKKEGLQKFIQTQHQAAHDKKSKGGDQKKQRMIKTKKKKIERLDRIGFGLKSGHHYREFIDNSPHAYKEYIPQAIEVDEKPVSFHLPELESSELHLEVMNSEVIFAFDNFSFGYAKNPFLVEHFTAQIHGGARIGVIGKNGSGKSTLVHFIVNESKHMKDDRMATIGKVECSAKLKVGFFSQDMVPNLPKGKTPCELILERCADLKNSNPLNVDLTSSKASFIYLDTIDRARQYLGAFGVTKDLGIRKIETLSGGQKSRVVFAYECLVKPNLLILDEPSNHLDLETIQVLSESLKRFDGALMLVSHDRYFLGELVDELWIVDEKKHMISQTKKSATESTQDFLFKHFA